MKTIDYTNIGVELLINNNRNKPTFSLHEKWVLLSALKNVTSISLGGSPNNRVEVSTAFMDLLCELPCLSSIDVSCSNISVLPSKIGSLAPLVSLNISHTHILEFPASADLFNSLHSLSISFVDLGSIPEYFFHLSQLMTLDLSGSCLDDTANWLGELTNLRYLNLSNTSIKNVPEEIRLLQNLRRLDLSDTNIEILPEWIGELTKLNVLNLSNTSICKLPNNLGNNNNLTDINLAHTKINNLPHSFNQCDLRSLDLSETEILKVPAVVEKQRNIQKLKLSNTKITSLPDYIGDFNCLRYLDISYCKLDEIPVSIINLNIPFITVDPLDYYSDSKHINIYRTKLNKQPISLFMQPLALIKDYYNSEITIINTTKCIILGHGHAGKTHTLTRIQNEGKKENYVTNKTPGIDVKAYTVPSSLSDREFTINFWDFGGQQNLFPIHRCFLTERTCYLVVVGTRIQEMNLISQIRFWLKNIADYAPFSPVLIFVNLWDNDRYRGIDEEAIYQEFEGYLDIKGFVAISAKEASKNEFTSMLMSRIVAMASEMPSLDMKFPKQWSIVRNSLRNMKKQTHYISQEQYYRLCVDSGIRDQYIQKWLLEWFNDLGECFSYYKGTGMGDNDYAPYKVLDPRWIVNAIYIIVTQGEETIPDIAPGCMSRKDIIDVLKDAKGGVARDITGYDEAEVDYILQIMQKFELSVPANKTSEFIPALLSPIMPKKILPDSFNSRLVYELHYLMLPESIVQRLMVRRYKKKLDKCWYKGCSFLDDDEQLAAVVSTQEGTDILRIEVRGWGNNAPRKMLDAILSDLDIIHSKNNLRPKRYIVIDKDQEGRVSVDRLIDLKKRGEEYYQGRFFDFSISKLLGETFGETALKKADNLQKGNGRKINVETLEHLQREELQEVQRDKILIALQEIISYLSTNHDDSVLLLSELKKASIISETISDSLNDILLETTRAGIVGPEKDTMGYTKENLSSISDLATIAQLAGSIALSPTAKTLFTVLLEMLKRL